MGKCQGSGKGDTLPLDTMEGVQGLLYMIGNWWLDHRMRGICCSMAAILCETLGNCGGGDSLRLE